MGHGIIFTIGKGNELCCKAVDLLSEILLGKSVKDVFDNFSHYFNKLTNEPQLRWVGPEKGVVHLSVAGIINALWDLLGKLEKKPLWKLLVDMDPEYLVNTLNFKYVEDVLTREEALQILKDLHPRRQELEQVILSQGYPAYTTGCAWSGYPDEKVQGLCSSALSRGFKAFKVKVGMGLESDTKRLELMRRCIGEDAVLMVDSNQVWTVQQAIDNMKQLARFNLFWIEEPTSPDDAYGHSLIAKELNPLGIKVVTGEHAQNRVIHKHFNVLNGYQICQMDSARLAGVNEALVVMLMAKKFNKPVCMHAGGVGLCEMVIHLSIFDYIGITGSFEDRWCEYCDALHEHFLDPVEIKNGCYVAPRGLGYASDMKQESISQFSYPHGSYWRNVGKKSTPKDLWTGLQSFCSSSPLYLPRAYQQSEGRQIGIYQVNDPTQLESIFEKIDPDSNYFSYLLRCSDDPKKVLGSFSGVSETRFKLLLELPKEVIHFFCTSPSPMKHAGWGETNNFKSTL